MKKIIIFGTGGNCVDILDTLNEINRFGKRKKYQCVGFLDDDPSKWGKVLFGVKVLGPLSSSGEHPKCFFVNGIGSSSNFFKKRDILSKTGTPIERFETLVHPTSSVSRFSHIGSGTVVLQNVTVASNVRIGNHVMILPNTVISHDDRIGNHSCIAGGVCISGNVEIGDSCYLGTHCSVIGNVSIGAQSLIGMGSVVLNDVPENSVFVGNPARFLRKIQVNA